MTLALYHWPPARSQKPVGPPVLHLAPLGTHYEMYFAVTLNQGLSIW